MGSRFKGSTLRILASGLVGVALVAGVATSVFAQQHTGKASAGQAPMTMRGGAVHGAVRSGQVNLATLPAATAAQIKASAASARTVNVNRPMKSRAQQAANRKAATAHPTALPKAAGATAPTLSKNMAGGGALPQYLSEGAGINSTQAGGWYPPDQAISAAPGYVVEGVNNLMVVYTWSYAVKYGPWTPDQIFASVKHSGATFSDPQITYDPSRNKYLIAWLEITSDGNDYIDFAVSKTSTPSPLTNFVVVQVPATAAGTDLFCDYPTLGYDYWAMYVTCADFSVSGGGFLGNTLFALSINKALTGAISGWYWNNLPTNISCGSSCYDPMWRLSPTIEDGVPQAEWVTGTNVGYLGTNTSTNMTVCSVTNSHALESGSGPTTTCAFSALPLVYDDSIGATQPGTTAQVYTGDGYKQVAYRNGQLYFALPIGITCSGTVENGILWGIVTPQLSTFAAHNPQYSTGLYSNFSQAGYWCYSNADSYMPTLMAGTEGDAVLVMNYSSSGTYPSIAYTGRAAADAPGTMGQSVYSTQVIAGAHSNDSGRWGDYSACSLTTNLTTRGIVFCAGEYGGSHTALGGYGWDTELYGLRME
jgi:hypothetical protein